MMIMEDKEVGELWLECYRIRETGEGSLDVHEWANVCEVLIRKLVEERANWYQGGDRKAPIYQDRIFPKYRELALRDFGIDPETWKESK